LEQSLAAVLDGAGEYAAAPELGLGFQQLPVVGGAPGGVVQDLVGSIGVEEELGLAGEDVLVGMEAQGSFAESAAYLLLSGIPGNP